MSNSSAALRLTLQHLSSALVYTDASNAETNRKLWNEYAKSWRKIKQQNKLDQTNNQTTEQENTTIPALESPSSGSSGWLNSMCRAVGRSVESICYLGDEWADQYSFQSTIQEFLMQHCTLTGASTPAVIGEIGPGGGRVAHLLAPAVSRLHLFDVSDSMLAECQSSLNQYQHIEYHLIPPITESSPVHDSAPFPFPSSFSCQFDFLVCFDVFPHCDLHLIFHYLKAFEKLLKPNGRAFLSFADLTTPLGFQRFSKQKLFTAGGFYFLSPQMVFLLIQKAGLKVIKWSESGGQGEAKESEHTHNAAFGIEGIRVRDPKNMYYNRDLVVLLEKPSTNAGTDSEVN